MDTQELIRSLSHSTSSKIILLVLDGLGGLPQPETGKTELETASTPNLDKLAIKGVCGLSDPIAPGITPGSAPGHLALFGYDPIRYEIGRGVLEATGIDFAVQPGDVAARGNFCTVDGNGLVTDRRAGRISDEKCTELCQILDRQHIDGIEVIVRPVRGHRFVAVFRGEGLSPEVNDSDPQQVGLLPLDITARNIESVKLANIANKFISSARELLAEQNPANMVLFRGFSGEPGFPSMKDIYKLNPAAVAGYPMYRGLARLVGMDTLDTGPGISDVFATVKEYYEKYDFFFLHYKPTDAAGEDGDFDRKVKAIEEVDEALPELTALDLDVLVVTGDHSTPAILKGHSWHPVPILLSSKFCRADDVKNFSESSCVKGGLGRISTVDIMPLAMANALKLKKFGA
ncbi:MAG TPA: 2,3-bisphosphoglycerate-independent phosphoglycerate mutase [Dehalococcoidia bacterium]|nr:2,3-bisphosphoglycerate-independent phosphoglycerate mutase [Dehalococcoidia bacterium]